MVNRRKLALSSPKVVYLANNHYMEDILLGTEATKQGLRTFTEDLPDTRFT